jgi:hypothetical protein
LTPRRVAVIAVALLAAAALIALATGCDKRMSDEEADKAADEVIARDFPDMVDAEKSVQSYVIEGRDFYEVAYGKTVEYQTETGTISAPRIVVVTIDRNTGEEIVAVSD